MVAAKGLAFMDGFNLLLLILLTYTKSRGTARASTLLLPLNMDKQKTIRRQVASLYLCPQTLEMPILDALVAPIKKPVGLLHVKVVRARKLLKMDILGASDPYVKLSLSGERLPAKKTSIKMKT
ncbi:Synaptotagmin-3 [Vitis vinifera]|uniref:Synaptotagmin-3 n=1 Tax=Vitis vinifera TaxID=29760 RepID=A0A438F077_VITVI|nr:Synaptotagmin-3 [Vitis vinifera]